MEIVKLPVAATSARVGATASTGSPTASAKRRATAGVVVRIVHLLIRMGASARDAHGIAVADLTDATSPKRRRRVDVLDRRATPIRPRRHLPVQVPRRD